MEVEGIDLVTVGADNQRLLRPRSTPRPSPLPKALGDARKIVVSNQDLQFTWRNSEQLKGDLVEAVTALTNEPGATDIAMSESISVVRHLLGVGLLDELHLLVHPTAVRKDAPVRRLGVTNPVPVARVPGLHHRCLVPHLRPGPSGAVGNVRRGEGAFRSGVRTQEGRALPAADGPIGLTGISASPERRWTM
jgi:hypothetical protein